MEPVLIASCFSKKPIPARWEKALEAWLERIERVLRKGRV